MLNLQQLEELKQELRHLVAEGIGEALRAVKESLPSHCPKQDAVLALQSRLNDANRQKIQGVLSQEQLQLAYNQLRADLLTLIRSLTPDDFAPALPPEKLKDKKTGQVLYNIPNRMQIEREARCIVRLAFDIDTIIRDIELTEDVTVKTVRISEVMNVALVDPNAEAAFLIRSFSSEEQFVEREDYTEWIFYVTPLREGVFPLLLKVSVMEIVRDKERRKDIVMEESIQIIAAAPEVTTAEFQRTSYQISLAGSAASIPGQPEVLEVDDFIPISPRLPMEPSPIPPPAPQPKVPAPRQSRLHAVRRTLAIAASFLVIVSVSVFLIRQQFNNPFPTDQVKPAPPPVEEPGDSLEIESIPVDSSNLSPPSDTLR